MESSRGLRGVGRVWCEDDGLRLVASDSTASAVAEPSASWLVGLDTDTVKWTVKTLLSHLTTLERIRFSREFFTDTTYVRVEPVRGSLATTSHNLLTTMPGLLIAIRGSVRRSCQFRTDVYAMVLSRTGIGADRTATVS